MIINERYVTFNDCPYRMYIPYLNIPARASSTTFHCPSRWMERWRGADLKSTVKSLFKFYKLEGTCTSVPALCFSTATLQSYCKGGWTLVSRSSSQQKKKKMPSSPNDELNIILSSQLGPGRKSRVPKQVSVCDILVCSTSFQHSRPS